MSHEETTKNLRSIIYDIIVAECEYRRNNALAPIVCSELVVLNQIRALSNIAIKELEIENKIKSTNGVNIKFYSV